MQANADGGDDGDADGGDDGDGDETPVTADEYVANAPEEIREVLESGRRMHKAKKEKLVDTLMGNERNKFTKEQLEAKDVIELETLAELAYVAVNYEANAGPGDGSGEEALVMPAMDFDTK